MRFGLINILVLLAAAGIGYYWYTNYYEPKITYDYDNYDSIEHYHQIHLRHSNLIFEYYNELDETIVKEHMEE